MKNSKERTKKEEEKKIGNWTEPNRSQQILNAWLTSNIMQCNAMKITDWKIYVLVEVKRINFVVIFSFWLSE